LMAGDDDEMFMTRNLNVTPKTTEQHLVVHSDKSVTYETKNKRLRSTYCTIEANYKQIQASRGVFATAELFVKGNEVLICAKHSNYTVLSLPASFTKCPCDILILLSGFGDVMQVYTAK